MWRKSRIVGLALGTLLFGVLMSSESSAFNAKNDGGRAAEKTSTNAAHATIHQLRLMSAQNESTYGGLWVDEDAKTIHYLTTENHTAVEEKVASSGIAVPGDWRLEIEQAKVSMADLKSLQDRIFDLREGLGAEVGVRVFGVGIDERNNEVLVQTEGRVDEVGNALQRRIGLAAVRVVQGRMPTSAVGIGAPPGMEGMKISEPGSSSKEGEL